MAKRKSRQKKVSRRTNNKRINDISNHTLMTMVILVLVVSMISVGLYMYTFSGNNSFTKVQKSQSETSVMEDRGAVSGLATMQIINPSEEKAVQ